MLFGNRYKSFLIAFAICSVCTFAAPAQSRNADAGSNGQLSPERSPISQVDMRRSQSSANSLAATRPMAFDNPSAVYRLGAGDIVRIELKNTSAGSRYVKVGPDGRINFPLAGEDLIAAGMTIGQLEEMLGRSIKLFAQPKVKAEVIEYTSHVISIAGLVDQPGQQQIQRDAIPFYVVRAGVVMDRRATHVRIIRDLSLVAEEYGLADAELGNVLVYPGDTVEFIDHAGLTKN